MHYCYEYMYTVSQGCQVNKGSSLRSTNVATWKSTFYQLCTYSNALVIKVCSKDLFSDEIFTVKLCRCLSPFECYFYCFPLLLKHSV